MTTPNPYTHKKFVVCRIVDLDAEYTVEPPLVCDAHTTSNRLQVEVWYPDSERYSCEEISPKDIGEILSFMNTVTQEPSDPSYGAVLASFHNKGVIQRFAWWYSRKEFINWQHLPLFSDNYRNVDIVDLYNGPAIVTAEQRYAFSLDEAKQNVGLTDDHDAYDLLKRLIA